MRTMPNGMASSYPPGWMAHAIGLTNGGYRTSASSHHPPWQPQQQARNDDSNDNNTFPGAAVGPNGINLQNFTKAVQFGQLLEMGFEKQEIMDGIQQLCQQQQDSNSNSVTNIPSTDEIMLHLVTQREEAEEARKEDEVRLRSEEQQHEVRQRREESQTESLSKVTTYQEIRKIFPKSWVLNSIAAADDVDDDDNNKTKKKSSAALLSSKSRKDFVELLKLEEKSRKWYGWVLPSGYFRRVGDRLDEIDKEEREAKKNENSNNCTFLKDECQRLRSGLYELEEQVKGQPKIFLDENKKEKSGDEAEIICIDDDDD